MDVKKKTSANESNNSSVVRAFDILELLNTNGQPMTIADLCRELNLNRITCTNLVKTMIAKKYLYKNERGKLCLTGKVYVMGQIYKDSFPALERFNILSLAVTQKYGCTSHMATFAGLNQGILLSRIPSVSLYSDSLYLYVPLYCTGTGKVLLAYQQPQVRKNIVDSMNLVARTANTITERGELIRELEAVRVQGYGIDREEYRPGLFCVSAPVFDKDGNVNTAVSLSNLSISPEHPLEFFIPAVKELAHSLSFSSGYRNVSLEAL